MRGTATEVAVLRARLTYDRFAGVLFLLLLLSCGYFLRSALSDNETAHLDLALAIVEEGRFTIDSFHNAPIVGTSDKSLYQGHYYSNKAIGTGLFGALVYRTISWPVGKLARAFGLDERMHLLLLKYMITLGVVGIPSAFATSLLYLLCHAIIGSRRQAYAVTMVTFFGTMLWPFSTLLFAHALAAALLFGAFFLVVRMRFEPATPSAFPAGAAAFLASYAIQVEYTSAILVFGIAVYAGLLVRAGEITLRRRSAVSAILMFLVPWIPYLVYNAVSFGSPFSTSYSHVVNFGNVHGQGFLGVTLPDWRTMYYLTVHPYRGLFAQSPVLVAAVMALPIMFRAARWRFEAGLAAFAFVGYLMMNTGYAMWWAGWTFAPRLLIPMLPFLALPLLFAWKRAPRLVAAMSAWSAVQMLIPTVGNPLVPDTLVQATAGTLPFWGTSPILGDCLQSLVRGQYARNLGMLMGLRGVASLVPLFIVLGGASLWLFRRRSWPDSPAV